MTKSGNVAYRAVDAMLRTALRRIPTSSFAESVALQWGYRYQPAPGSIRLRSGALLQTTHVDHLQLLLYYLGTFEPHCLDAMRENVRPGDTMLDVGANIGLFTIEGAKAVGPSGTVISIEASPNHAGTVRKSCDINKFENVEIHAVAVGDKDGEAQLTLPRNANFGMFTLGKVAGDESFGVPVRRIDDLVGSRKIDFIKMDIEGSEYNALLGASLTIERWKPAILIELNDTALLSCDSSSRQVKDFLFERGYSGRILTSKQLVGPSQDHPCDECLFTAK